MHIFTQVSLLRWNVYNIWKKVTFYNQYYLKKMLKFYIVQSFTKASDGMKLYAVKVSTQNLAIEIKKKKSAKKNKRFRRRTWAFLPRLFFPSYIPREYTRPVAVPPTLYSVHASALAHPNLANYLANGKCSYNTFCSYLYILYTLLCKLDGVYTLVCLLCSQFTIHPYVGISEGSFSFYFYPSRLDASK